jgi:hypothetical protein
VKCSDDLACRIFKFEKKLLASVDLVSEQWHSGWLPASSILTRVVAGVRASGGASPAARAAVLVAVLVDAGCPPASARTHCLIQSVVLSRPALARLCTRRPVNRRDVHRSAHLRIAQATIAEGRGLSGSDNAFENLGRTSCIALTRAKEWRH